MDTKFFAEADGLEPEEGNGPLSLKKPTVH